MSTPASAAQSLKSLFNRSEVLFALGLMCVIMTLLLPLPQWLLDFGIALSLTFSLLVLMTCLFIEKPLQFSSFPTVLLVSTMLRLALNVASTRLVLTHGHEGVHAAGKAIQAFGDYVMSGNFVIGLIVFAILVLVNFVVITKGSGRIAEVAARFSLDAMPGKQMAVDADLSSGLITEQEAKDRRKELEDESSFYGAMDGAAKFVRGDAVAGLIITFIDIAGGIIIGTVQKNLSFAAASERYITLTVGDGLVSQVPALIISIAAGMLVSKSGSKGSIDKALFGQLSAHPSALGLCSALIGGLGLLPGLPAVPFLGLASLLAFISYQVSLTQDKDAASKQATEKITHEQATSQARDPTERALQMDMIRLELGYSLLPLMRETKPDQNLSEQMKKLRTQLASEIGFILPSVRIQDNINLPSHTYAIYIKEIEAARGELQPDQILVMNPGGNVPLPGQETTEPTFGLAAKWISPALADQAQQRGYTVIQPTSVVMTHLTEIIKDNLVDLLTFTETEKLLERLDEAHQKLLKEIVPSQISRASIQRILQNLLDERISVRDLPTILEAIAEASAYHKDISATTEHVRSRLSRQICADHSDENGVLPLITISPEWEHAFIESIITEGDGKQLAMAPSKLQDFIQSVSQVYAAHLSRTVEPVLLVSPVTRVFVRSVLERFRPQTAVLSQNDIHPKIKIMTCDQIT